MTLSRHELGSGYGRKGCSRVAGPSAGPRFQDVGHILERQALAGPLQLVGETSADLKDDHATGQKGAAQLKYRESCANGGTLRRTTTIRGHCCWLSSRGGQRVPLTTWLANKVDLVRWQLSIFTMWVWHEISSHVKSDSPRISRDSRA